MKIATNAIYSAVNALKKASVWNAMRKENRLQYVNVQQVSSLMP
jgi:hypothetical protein